MGGCQNYGPLCRIYTKEPKRDHNFENDPIYCGSDNTGLFRKVVLSLWKGRDRPSSSEAEAAEVEPHFDDRET